VHDNWLSPFVLGAEKKAASATSSPKSLVQLIHDIRENSSLRSAPHWGDGNKVRDGIIARAADEMIKVASQWRVDPSELNHKAAEMINADAYFTGAAQNPPKKVKIDFFYMHCMNCSIFFSSFLEQDWMKVEDKVRLLEWKGRVDLAMYASRASPELKIEEIKEYKPKHNGGWEGVIKRVDVLDDDGHAAKLIRALANGELRSKEFEDQGGEAFPIKGDMWLKLAHMVIDSVEGAETRWVRSCGFPEAWEKIGNRAKL